MFVLGGSPFSQASIFIGLTGPLAPPGISDGASRTYIRRSPYLREKYVIQGAQTSSFC